jgi:hypothetical protein
LQLDGHRVQEEKAPIPALNSCKIGLIHPTIVFIKP